MEKILDIERLHEETEGRQSGRTTRMLVEAIQNVDFCNKQHSIRILAHTEAYARQLSEEAIWIAEQLGFENINSRGIRLIVNDVDILFQSVREPQNWLRNDDLTFADHFVHDQIRDTVVSIDVLA